MADPIFTGDITDALDRYLAGEAAPEEQAHVERWIAGDPARERILAFVRQPDGAVPQARHAAVAERLEQRIRLSAHPAPRPSRVERNALMGVRHRVWYGALAICGILMGVYGLRQRLIEPAPVRSYGTALGQRSVIHLPDGSAITLAPGTSLQMRGDNLALSGEAQFVVASRVSRPFTVRTHNATVQVLGTTFLVRQYADESSSRVVVRDGKVSVHCGTRAAAGCRPTVLGANMMAHVRDSSLSVMRDVQSGDYARWTTGILVFRDVELGKVIVELARAYGKVIVIDDSALAHKEMTLDVSIAEQSITRVLDLIGIAANAHYAPDSVGYVLRAGRTRVSPPRHRTLPQLEKQYGR
jgi:ferric-dicitrate binding protein FerR (iron transport regulator)